MQINFSNNLIAFKIMAYILLNFELNVNQNRFAFRVFYMKKRLNSFEMNKNQFQEKKYLWNE